MSNEIGSVSFDMELSVTLQLVTRDELYAKVWNEPMLRVAAYFDVSSSYLARVCSELRIPRPPRGHWAKLEFGKESPQPPLPEVQPGDVTVWQQGQMLSSPKPKLAPSPKPDAKKHLPIRPKPKLAANHDLVDGVKPFFLKARGGGKELLRPTKKLLVDIMVSESLLDEALETANAIFQKFAEYGYHAMLVTSQGIRWAEVDEREVPRKGHHHRTLWSPARPTAVFIGNVAIGLTLFEMTEEIDVVYVNGKYIPHRSLTPQQLQRYKGPLHWSTKNDVPSGRLCLQAYCPNWNVEWSRQWRKTKPRQLRSQTAQIVHDLDRIAPTLAKRVEEAESLAVSQRIAREEEYQRYLMEAARAKKAKLRADSRSDLLAAIADWDEVRRIYDFFAAAEAAIGDLVEAERAVISNRLDQARELVGGLDPLVALKNWKPPDER